MTNEELIKQLRGCKDIEFCNECPRMPNGIIEPCGIKDDAADALEAAENRIAELNTKCADLQSQINSMENEIEELLPKEGEWIDMGDFEMCSVCKIAQRKKYRQYNGGFTWVRTAFCPKCGTRMMKGEQE